MLRVLLVEDSDCDAFIIQKALKEHVEDVKCTRAENVSKGEKILDEMDFDVILLDLGLPDSSSPSYTYEHISKHAKNTPIVISTNVNDHDLARSLVHDGAEDYMNKDMIAEKPEHVRDAIDFAIERHAQLKKMISEKDGALKDSKQKDVMLNCFMGGYSVSNKE